MRLFRSTLASRWIKQEVDIGAFGGGRSLQPRRSVVPEFGIDHLARTMPIPASASSTGRTDVTRLAQQIYAIRPSNTITD